MLKSGAVAADIQSMSRLVRRLPALLLSVLALLTSGCDQLGIESATAVAARKEADGKAIGGACRHAGRAIEDCYALNKKADRASVYAGWREMNEYMRENKIDPVPPVLQPPSAVAAKPADDHEGPAEPEPKAKGPDKSAAKGKKHAS